jgi:serine phosphatase RsbU (regulator of sigma subunit)
MEVWGGSQLTDQSVTFGGLDAWVYSKPFGGAHSGGDVYYASSCATGRINRLLLADVAGHGTTAAAAAADLRTLMRRFVNRLDQTEFVSLLNQEFAALSRAGVFATAVVTTFFAPTRRLMLCNAGHPRPVIYRADSREWDFLGELAFGNLPLGLIPIAEYQQFDVELAPGDCLLNYSDALIESSDADGEMLGETGLLRVVRLLGDTTPDRLIPVLLKEIGERYPQNLSDDDVTVMVIRANGGEAHFTLSEKLDALKRFAATMLRAIRPGSERPPLPDANLANMGGALIPALARRWRARSRRVR